MPLLRFPNEPQFIRCHSHTLSHRMCNTLCAWSYSCSVFWWMVGWGWLIAQLCQMYILCAGVTTSPVVIPRVWRVLSCLPTICQSIVWVASGYVCRTWLSRCLSLSLCDCVHHSIWLTSVTHTHTHTQFHYYSPLFPSSSVCIQYIGAVP